MKLLISAFILMSVYSCHYGQKPTESKCKLQELAIHAALGDADAQYDLGVEFHRGVDIAQDYSKAAVMWRLASNGGVIPAFNNLGYLTYYGKGVKQDYAEGVRLWRVAAEKGFAEAQVHLADAYSDGRYLKQDYVESYAWSLTGKHFGAQIEDTELGKRIIEMAENRLADARKRLSESQVAEAEKRAAEYITKFAPK
jgi:TPR repeat protein